MLALFFPAVREGFHEIGEAEAVRLAAIQDGFDDVGCQLGHPDRLGKLAVIQHFTLGKFHNR